MHNFLVETFGALNNAGVFYVVLRPGEDPHSGNNLREVDLLVPPNQLKQLAVLLEQQGFVAMPSWGRSRTPPGDEHVAATSRNQRQSTQRLSWLQPD